MLESLAVGRFARPEADSRRFSGGWMLESLAVGLFGRPEEDSRRFSGRWMRIFVDSTFSTFLTHSDLQEVRVYIVAEVNRAKENAEEKTKRCLLLKRSYSTPPAQKLSIVWRLSEAQKSIA